MWHEARKQEKKIRGMLVDYRKRAERRQDFYERIKADPTQFLQVHGRKCKIHLDASVAAAAENPAIMMPWQGQKDNLIDRFDVRAHLDYIAPVASKPDQPAAAEDDVLDMEERSMNYERYRVLAQNEFLGISEEKFLHQLFLEEQFGVNAQVEAEQRASSSKKKAAAAAGGGVAIGYTYEETEPSGVVPFTQTITAIEQSAGSSKYDECMKSDSDSDLDMDVSIDINKLGTAQAHEMNACGRHYGMKSNDFYSYLTKDSDEAEALRMAREEEQEKIMFSGRKSRRERRAQREKKFAGRPLSPPSYAAKEELVPRTYDDPNDSSRSPSPVNSGKITYITSFGGEDELQPHSKISISFNKDSQGGAGSSRGGASTSYAEKVKQNLEKLKSISAKEEESRIPAQYQRRSRSYSDRSRSGSRSRRRRHSRSRSRGRRTYSKYRRRSRSVTSRSRSRSRGYRSSRRSPDYSSRRRKTKSSSSGSSSPPVRKPARKSSSSESDSSASSRSRSPPRSKPTFKTEPPERKPVVTAPSPAPPSTSLQPVPPVAPPAPIIVKKEEKVPAVLPVEPEPEVPVRRYYGRKRDGQKSSSEDDITSDSSGDESSKPSATTATATEPSHSITPPPGEFGGYFPAGFSIKQEKLEPSSSRFGGSAPVATATTTVGGTSSTTSESKVSKNNSSFTLSLRILCYHHQNHHHFCRERAASKFCVEICD
uniref:Putative swap mrna splicing regulator n=1 Tax=Culex tarsalis TaxID=7177 RepID=A0A1Q3G3C2_CULTA